MGDEAGLKHILFEKEKNQVVIQDGWQQKPGFFSSGETQLKAYFKLELRHFDLRLAPEDTAFQQKVWQALQNIPYGELFQIPFQKDDIRSC